MESFFRISISTESFVLGEQERPLVEAALSDAVQAARNSLMGSQFVQNRLPPPQLPSPRLRSCRDRTPTPAAQRGAQPLPPLDPAAAPSAAAPSDPPAAAAPSATAAAPATAPAADPSTSSTLTTALRRPAPVVIDLEEEEPQPSAVLAVVAAAPASSASSAASPSPAASSPGGTRAPVVVPRKALPSCYSYAWRELAKEATDDVQAPQPPAKKQKKPKIALPGPRVKVCPRARNSKGQFLPKTPAPPPASLKPGDDVKAPRTMPQRKGARRQIRGAARKSRVGQRTRDGDLIIADSIEEGLVCEINGATGDEEEAAFSSEDSSSESDGDFEL